MKRVIASFEEISLLRAAQRQASEHAAQREAAARDAAKNARIEVAALCAQTYDDWSNSVSEGHQFDPVMSGLWAHELRQCEVHLSEAENAETEKAQDYAAATDKWRQAAMLADVADKKLRDASRQQVARRSEYELAILTDMLAWNVRCQ